MKKILCVLLLLSACALVQAQQEDDKYVTVQKKYLDSQESGIPVL